MKFYCHIVLQHNAHLFSAVVLVPTLVQTGVVIAVNDWKSPEFVAVSAVIEVPTNRKVF